LDFGETMSGFFTLGMGLGVGRRGFFCRLSIEDLKVGKFTIYLN
jgi:hypothetical protein